MKWRHLSNDSSPDKRMQIFSKRLKKLHNIWKKNKEECARTRIGYCMTEWVDMARMPLRPRRSASEDRGNFVKDAACARFRVVSNRPFITLNILAVTAFAFMLLI